ncbi:MAG: hypothetical protein MI861_00255, partial [Pirellulales bacterium]|nr:hypothetical protein [Pirellulales bacterium]
STSTETATGSSTTYNYDQHGNQSTSGTAPFNRIAKDASNYYEYDAEGNVKLRKTYKSVLTEESLSLLNYSAAYWLTHGSPGTEVDSVDVPGSVTSGTFRLRLQDIEIYSFTDTGTPNVPLLTLKVEVDPPNSGTVEVFNQTITPQPVNGSTTLFEISNYEVSFGSTHSGDMRVIFEYPDQDALLLERFYTTSGKIYIDRLDRTIDYEWNHRNDLDKVTALYPGSTVGARTVEYSYDAFGNLVGRKDSYGASLEEEFYINEFGSRLLTLEAVSVGGTRTLQLDKHELRIPDSNGLLLVEDWDYDAASGNANNHLVLWTMADPQGTIRHVVKEQSGAAPTAYKLTYDDFGRAHQEVDHDDTLPVERVRYRFQGLLYDPAAEVYFVDGKYYAPTGARLISEDRSLKAYGDSNPYRFGNNSPERLEGGATPGVMIASSKSSYFDHLDVSTVGHSLLDAVGMIPVVGIAADLGNGIWYAAEGDHLNAGFSFGAAVPGLGYLANAAKLGGKATKLYKSSLAADIAVNGAQSSYAIGQGMATIAENPANLSGYAQVGMGAFGFGVNARAASRFNQQCFIAGTEVWVPSETMSTGASMATIAAVEDVSRWSWQQSVGVGLLVTGIAGWFMFEPIMQRKKYRRRLAAHDSIFGQELDWGGENTADLDEIFGDLSELFGASERPHRFAWSR